MLDAKRRGWPLTVQEMLKAQLNREDEELHPYVASEVPAFEVKPLVGWGAAALYQFRREIVNVLHP